MPVSRSASPSRRVGSPVSPKAAKELVSADPPSTGTVVGGTVVGGTVPARPWPVTVAAVMTALIGAVLITYGGFLVIAGFTGQPVLRGRAELAGVIFLIFGLGIAWAARGLVRLEPWSRTPAMLTLLMLLGVAYWLRQGGLNAWAGVSTVVGLAGTVLLFLPASHRVLSRGVARNPE